MSKNVIFYFSGTGNSLAVAQILSKQLGDAIIIPILSTDFSLELLDEVETIGLVYPIHVNAIPRVVKEFIGKLKLRSGCYFYGLATYGVIPGKAGCHLLNVAKDNGIELNGYFEISMINNTPKGVAPKLFMRLNWEKDIGEVAIKDMMNNVENDIPTIVTSIQNKDSQSIKKLQEMSRGFGYKLTRILWKMNESSNPKLKFLIDKTCTGCGICEKVCPSFQIKMVEGKPVWNQDSCYYCYACFNFCPEQAIYVKHYEKKLGRYHHPNVNWHDIATQKKTE